MTDIRDVLQGAIDLHRHGYPEISPDLRTPASDVDDIALCRDAGMAGVVLKSHSWPTMGRAMLLEQLVPGIRVISSVTLNPISGGMRPEVVELAAKQGAGVVYLPTVGAHNDIERGGISHTFETTIDAFDAHGIDGVTIADEYDRLTPEVTACLDVVDAHDLMVYSGHVSPREVLALARSRRLADRFVFSHPDSHSIGADDEVIQEVAHLGGFIEICALGTYPQIGRITPEGLARIIRMVGAERCVMTTDYFFDWCPPSSVMLADLAKRLVLAGITRTEIELMVRVNPAHLTAHAFRTPIPA
ncbi:DUF6282 family protein [Homoserinibacter sp. GY 40078]|uniref:DUF6282 family protein n=1 Tax=Homoserinibacter sp. GY 40078 TaxID=2603275 RepID=UPI0011CBE1FA|nr:DUF6282 family protein [Homoserinibacter sp. GY 40078]TXK19103.1 hypothetical protein FVQ89_04050 [Homoserinibacter sp. GY 40078]